MGSSIKNMPGFVALGSEAPLIDPHEVIIVGHDVPNVPELRFAFCPRVDAEVAEVAEEQRGEYMPGADALSIASIRERGVDKPFEVYRLKAPLTLPDGRVLDRGTPINLDGRRRTLRARVVWEEEKARRVPLTERKGAVRIIPQGGREANSFNLFLFNWNANTGKPMTAPQRAELVKIALDLLADEEATKPEAERRSEAEMHAIIAARMVVNPRTIKNLLAYKALDEDTQRAMTEGVEVAPGEVQRLPASLAPALAKMNPEERAQAIEDMKKGGRAKGAAAKKAVEKAAKRGQDDGEERVRVRPSRSLRLLATQLEDDLRGRRITDKQQRERMKEALGLLKWVLCDDKGLDDMPPMLQGRCVQSLERQPRPKSGK